MNGNETIVCNRGLIMKRGIVVAVACLLGTMVLASGSRPKAAKDDVSAGKSKPVKAVSAEKGWKLVAYYLHGTYRCPTCLSIERQSKEAIEVDFAGEIKAGKVVFLSLNYEETANEHFVKDYSLMTRSLVLSLRKDGKEVKWRNLPAIWTHVHTPGNFRAYVAGEVKTMLKEME